MNQNEYLLTYDIGSTAVKLILFSSNLRAEYTAEKEVKTYGTIEDQLRNIQSRLQALNQQ